MTLSKRVDAEVSQQVARWEEAGRSGQLHPCVAIANLPGTGGEAVGQRVAEMLHYGFFGREIVDEIGRRRGVSQELLHGLDGRMRSSIERYITDFFQGTRFTEKDYFQEVARAIATLGRRGMAVVAGRGAAFLLSPENALRVLVVAPLASRVARVAQERGLAPERAEAFVREEDAQRTEFVRHHFGTRIDDPVAYDLVVNTGVLGIELAAEAVVEVQRRRFPAARS